MPTPPEVYETNRDAVIGALRGGAETMGEIETATALSSTTVWRIVTDLEAAGVVEEVEPPRQAATYALVEADP